MSEPMDFSFEDYLTSDACFEENELPVADPAADATIDPQLLIQDQQYAHVGLAQSSSISPERSPPVRPPDGHLDAAGRTPDDHVHPATEMTTGVEG
jgi:hypothetical protein